MQCYYFELNSTDQFQIIVETRNSQPNQANFFDGLVDNLWPKAIIYDNLFTNSKIIEFLGKNYRLKKANFRKALQGASEYSVSGKSCKKERQLLEHVGNQIKVNSREKKANQIKAKQKENTIKFLYILFYIL